MSDHCPRTCHHAALDPTATATAAPTRRDGPAPDCPRGGDYGDGRSLPSLERVPARAWQTLTRPGPEGGAAWVACVGRALVNTNERTGSLGFEAKLWAATDLLRNNMDPAEYEHVVPDSSPCLWAAVHGHVSR